MQEIESVEMCLLQRILTSQLSCISEVIIALIIVVALLISVSILVVGILTVRR